MPSGTPSTRRRYIRARLYSRDARGREIAVRAAVGQLESLRASSACPQRSSRSSNVCALPLLTEKPLARNCPGTDRAEEPYAFVIGQEQRLFEHERQFAMALRASGAHVADRPFAFSDDPWQAHTFQADRVEHLWKRSDASSIV